MTDKVQKIREEVERLKGWNNNVRNSTRHMTLQEEDFNRGKHSSYLEILNFIDSLQEEPVSEDLEEVADKYESELQKKYKDKNNRDFDNYHDGFIDGLSRTYDAFKAGAQWQKEHLWKPADGDDLPEIEREVIAIVGLEDNGYKVVFAHRVNTDGYNGKSLITGETIRYVPKGYDKGGWNMPDVVYWLDTELPFKDE